MSEHNTWAEPGPREALSFVDEYTAQIRRETWLRETATSIVKVAHALPAREAVEYTLDQLRLLELKS